MIYFYFLVCFHIFLIDSFIIAVNYSPRVHQSGRRHWHGGHYGFCPSRLGRYCLRGFARGGGRISTGRFLWQRRIRQGRQRCLRARLGDCQGN